MPAEILVLGGGFAGLAAVGELTRLRRKGANVSVRLISREPHSVFLPLLPDVVSARVRPGSLCHPLGPHCRRRGAEFVQAEVREVRPDRREVLTDRGSFRADLLILALGCQSNYRGNAELRRRAPALTGVGPALAIRSSAEALADRAGAGREAGKAHVIIIGGGYTGFELASHLALRLRRRLGVSPQRLARHVGILVVEKGRQVLANVAEDARQRAIAALTASGVEVRTGVTVESFPDEQTICLSDGSVLPYAIAFWAAGVAPGPVASAVDTPKTASGRLAVDDYLRLPEYPRVFAAGDVAGAHRPGQDEPLRMGVQFSLAAGRCAAANAVAAAREGPLASFDPLDVGYLLPLSAGYAAGVVLGRHVHGRAGSLLHYSMSIVRSWSWRNRLALLADFLGPGSH